jgi:hypothetical protein
MLAIMKLPQSFTALACHGSRPATKVCRPIASNTGEHRSIVSPSPAATTSSFFAAAASGRPNTGALAYFWPRAACSAASLRASAVLIVLHPT